MNFKSLGFFSIVYAIIAQSVMFAAFSSTAPALRSFGRSSNLNRSFAKNPISESTQTRDLKWSYDLSKKMNPEVYNQAIESAKDSSISSVQSSKQLMSPTQLQKTFMVVQPGIFNDAMVLVSPVEELVLIDQLPLEQALNVFNARMYRFNQNIENIRAYRRYLLQDVSLNMLHLMDSKDSQFKIHDLINVDTYILKKALEERSLIQPMVENIDKYDLEVQKRILFYKNGLDFLIKFTSQMINDNEQLLEKVSNEEKVKYQNYQRSNRLAYSDENSDKFGDIPVEDPYQQVKVDVKNQFVKSAKIAAAGAGTLYGLKKLKQDDK